MRCDPADGFRALRSVVVPEAHGTDCPFALVTLQLAVPVGVAPPSEVTAGFTLPFSMTPFDVNVGFAVNEIAMVVGTVATSSWTWPEAEVPNWLNVIMEEFSPSGAAGDESETTATGANATLADSASTPRRRIRRWEVRGAHDLGRFLAGGWPLWFYNISVAPGCPARGIHRASRNVSSGHTGRTDHRSCLCLPTGRIW